MFTEAQALAWMERCRSALATTSNEPVIDACVFGRAGPLLGGANPLGAPLTTLVSRRRAGGLPERFALVLSASRLGAYALHEPSGDVDPGKALMTWDLADLRFSSAARGAFTEVIFESDGAQIAVRGARGERTDAFLRSLRDGFPS